MGRIGKGTKCSVTNCDEEAMRSISGPKVKAAGLNIEGRRVYLCKNHYKQYKKGSKKEKKMEKWRYSKG